MLTANVPVNTAGKCFMLEKRETHTDHTITQIWHVCENSVYTEYVNYGEGSL